jgi:large subunit ribosomal protein L25
MLEGKIRESTSKKETKTLRRDGYLIANIYGKGKENINAAFKENEFIRYVRNKETLAFDVKLDDGNVYRVVIQEYQKDPVTSRLLHVDLLLAQEGVKTYYQVPIKVVGTPKGLKNKGVLVYHRRRIKVKTTVEHLPNVFELDVTDLDVGDNILIRDIQFPEGVECYINPSVPVVGVVKAK